MTERKRPERRGQDPSGHISMDTSESEFFQSIQKRFAQIELAKQNGTMKYAAYRNPLAGEKTPRKDWLVNYDYSVPLLPDNMKKQEKWVYPESDWGIMGKFASQKPVYKKIYDKEQDMRNRIDAFRTLRDAQSQSIGADTQAATAATDSQNNIDNLSYSTKSSCRVNSKDFSSSDFRGTEYTYNDAPRQSARSTTDPKRIMDEYAPAAVNADALLSSQKVSSLKSLGSSNPEILAKWRAKRAASFVVKQKNPLEPPTPREITARAFKPSGTLTRDSAGEVVVATRVSDKAGKSRRPAGGAGGEPLESSRMQGSLGTLLDALKKTESDIERQELKIALNKSKK